jgi:3-hydroxyisobutyrate dehydrogenase-like beta-hydroxyacid dehydrogenase
MSDRSQPSAALEVGWLGLGGIGLPMARRLVEAGIAVNVCVNRDPAPAESLAADGATICNHPADAARDAQVVVSIVRDEAQSKTVLLGANGAITSMRAGTTLLIMSTVSADFCRRIADAAAAHGVDVLDAPVSGGAPRAASGELTIMVGGSPDVLDRVRPLLDLLASNVFRMGDVGAGQIAKIVNNAIKVAVLTSTTEGLDTGVRAGLDLDALLATLACSTSSSHVVTHWEYYAAFKREHRPGGPLDILAKDMALALDLAALHGTAVPVFEAAAAADIGRTVMD